MDSYDVRQLSEFFSDDFRSNIGYLRARWRWYTIDLLDLVDFGAPRSRRVGLHRAVRDLARAGRVQISAQLPYDNPFLAEVDYYGNQYGGIDLAEISRHADPRWPGRRGRSLWFRMPPPIVGHIPNDDQLAFLGLLLLDDLVPDALDEFIGTTDRPQAWASSTGHFVKWLFCGPAPGFPD